MRMKNWNENIKRLREIIQKPDKIKESVELCLELHLMVHSSEMSGTDIKTFEDELWVKYDENLFKTAAVEKGHTTVYSLWHISRIEDMTMNILVAGEEQIFNSGNWKDLINSNITDTGNALNETEAMEFSININIQELRNYRIAVGRRTREIISGLSVEDMKRKVEKDRLDRILAEGGVLNTTTWLTDYWGSKNTAGLLLMPATRHQVLHINESLKSLKEKRY